MAEEDTGEPWGSAILPQGPLASVLGFSSEKWSCSSAEKSIMGPRVGEDRNEMSSV